MTKVTNRFESKEISWLAFNARVLREAADPTVALKAKIKFLGIFSSNLDEFFRVRVANLKRLALLGKKANAIVGADPKKILATIQETFHAQEGVFESTYNQVLHELKENKIFVINEKETNPDQEEFVKNHFLQIVRPKLVPLMLGKGAEVPQLKDGSLYLAIRLLKNNGHKVKHAIIEVPIASFGRFVTLPRCGESQYIMFLEDVIRHCLASVFNIFNYDRIEAYSVKLSRDAELDVDDDLSESYVRKISKSLKQRKSGTPVHFVYDNRMSDEFLKLLVSRLHLNKVGCDLISGRKYLNLKDLMNFPRIEISNQKEAKTLPLSHRDFDARGSIFKAIRKKDILLHYPYQKFEYVIDFLREAAIDPKVTDIKLTLYRVANDSNIINALINAAKNGKSVTAVVELRARFDEEPNISWSEKLREEGVKVIHGVPGLKVHAKMIIVTRREKKQDVLYANIATGNLNEATAKLYSDQGLFTSNTLITKEIRKVFELIEDNYKRGAFRHLLVSPFNLRQKFVKLVNIEIRNAQEGKEAYITLKLNNLVDKAIITKLYQASQAGVDVKLMVRGMCSLLPQVKGLSENVEAKRIVDKFLEHTRLFAFCNDGNPRYYISSADLMSRNLDHRVEVVCPIYDRSIQEELEYFLDIQWRDNVKATWIGQDPYGRNTLAKNNGGVRAQDVFLGYCRSQLRKAEKSAKRRNQERI